MPLLPKGTVDALETKVIEIDEDWYKIRTQISGFHYNLIKDNEIRMQMQRKEAENYDPDSLVTMNLTSAKASELMLEIFLVDWSHEKENGKKEPINTANLRRLPFAHMKKLIDEIRTILDSQVEDLSVDSPKG